MRLSDLQSKDVVNIKDGKRIGRIIDIEIDTEGRILYLVVEQKRRFTNFVGAGSDSTITFAQISKIGEDIILVDF